MSKTYAYLRTAAPAAVLLLSACGGGGGGGPKPTPFVPTPTPTPTPTPDPTFPLTSSATFQTITAERTEQTGGAPNLITVTSLGVSGRGPTVTFSYDAATGTYTIKNDTTSATFVASSGSRSGTFNKYTLESGQTTDELTLFRNVASGSYSGIQLSYLSFGNWSHANSQTGERQLTYFLFGYPTATSDMPRSGSASYNTAVTGNIRDIRPTVDGVTEYQVGGSATFSANFGSGTVSTELTLVRSDQLQLGSYSGMGTISANEFSGTFSSTNQYFHSGAFMGGFFGPAAAEMGYTFTIRNYNPDPTSGASVNYVDQWIAGTVVGTKTGN